MAYPSYQGTQVAAAMAPGQTPPTCAGLPSSCTSRLPSLGMPVRPSRLPAPSSADGQGPCLACWYFRAAHVSAVICPTGTLTTAKAGQCVQASASGRMHLVNAWRPARLGHACSTAIERGALVSRRRCSKSTRLRAAPGAPCAQTLLPRSALQARADAGCAGSRRRGG